MIDQKVYGLH